MKISVDISLYPLHEDYIPVIIDFIHRVELHEGIDMVRNQMSTQLFGEYDRVMKVLTEELRHSFETHGKAVIVAKIVNGDVRAAP
ncbi:MAG: hypothetical protein IPJ33_18955 [Gammaproteobacteria bacterium]|jgi:uncharacterized protein YqgV (UPF0045/DUF77 family)|nr:hypothetical protein [Gammaproteobacteria bacterium]MBP6051541.1 hypothetical protein [Pseudomonadales bacterium]MBK6582608.1 hypothetical protein [Gammaproteobacteria bacterium]MBK7167881.1 hypothetical protein [Gammaproteobacteria bacterium]MBK7518740.1 hypothetical protein [Gammaproteobacteria bacterium]